MVAEAIAAFELKVWYQVSYKLEKYPKISCPCEWNEKGI
jgi:hypothetical protein